MLSFVLNKNIETQLIYFYLVILIGTSIYSIYKKDTRILSFTFFNSLLFFVICRIPVINYNQALNPDESMFITGALGLSRNLIFWKDIDGCTSAIFNFLPINFYCEIFNQPYDFKAARIVSIVLISLSFIFSFFACKKLFNTQISFIANIPFVIYFSLSLNFDFLHYSSELLSISILSLEIFLFSLLLDYKQKTKTLLFFGGFLTGLLIFTKLQVIPPAFFIFCSFGFVAINRQEKVKNLAYLIFGALVPVVSMILYSFKNATIENILVYYLKNNLFYGYKSNIFQNVVSSFLEHNSILIKLIVIAYVVFVFVNIYLKDFGRRDKKNFLILTYSLGVVISVFKTGYIFEHYTFYLIFPLILLLSKFIRLTENKTNLKFKLLIFLLLITIINAKAIVYYNYTNFENSINPKNPRELSKAGKIIKNHIKPTEELAIWGENGNLYIENNYVQSIKWSHTLWGMYSDSLQSSFKKEYLKQLEINKPKIFVDANFTKKTDFEKLVGIESFPELNVYIRNNYELIGSVDFNRIYKIKHI